MRKSNLLLLAAGAVLLVALVSYNLSVKAAYQKSVFKAGSNNFKALDIQDFEAIDVNAASNLDVQIVPGAFRVELYDKSMETVRVVKTGKRLQIDVEAPPSDEHFGRVIISCPSISEITTNSIFLPNGKKEIRTQGKMVGTVKVSGFILDSLLLIQDNASGIQMAGNTIGVLRSISAMTPGSVSHLEIGAGNSIGEADLTLRNKARLEVINAEIAKLKHDFGDSTQVTFTGIAKQLLKQ